MPRRRLSVPALALVLCAAVALWLSAGALTVANSDPEAQRVGLLPSVGWLALLLAAGLVVTLVARLPARRAGVLALSLLVLLPWIPLPVPAAFFVWVGPLRVWLWIAVAVVLAGPAIVGAARRSPISAMAGNPRRAPWLAAAVAVCLYLAAAWQVFPRLPGGDEPHYLVITQSLLADHDLKIENNHRQGDYRAYFRGDLPKPDYLRRGANGEIYSVHAPGLPALIAPSFALLGYPGVLMFLALVSGCGTALAWTATWRVTRDAAASWFGWAAVALSVPFFFQSFVVFPDGPGAVLVMIGVLAMMVGREASLGSLAATGVALACLPWLHTRFALLAGVLGVLIAARNIGAAGLAGLTRRLAVLLAVPAVSAAAWFWFFYAIYGTPNPAAPYGGYTQTSVANVPRGVIGLLFDQQFGLLPNAPIYVCAGLGLITLMKTRLRLALELLLVVVPYALAAAAYYMWWAGYSSPARFLVAIVLPLAIPAGAWFAASGRGGRVVGLAALLLSVLITGALAAVDHGALLYNVRQTAAAAWLVWISPLVNIATGVPSFFQNSPRLVLEHAVVWALAIAATAWTGTLLGRRRLPAQMVALGVGLMAAVSGMTALTVVWHSNHALPLTPTTGSLALLRQSDRGRIAVRYSPLRRMPIADLAPAIVLAHNTGGAAAHGPLLALPRPPAATYEIDADVTGPGARRVSVTTDRELGPQWSWDLSGAQGAWRQTISLPIAVPGLAVDGDPGTRRAIGSISIRALRVLPPRERLTGAEPVHAVRYGPAVVFLLAGHVYMEPSGAWVAGGGFGEFVVSPDPGAPIRLFVRNAPVQNDVTLESGAWRQTLTLQPREERLFDVPVEPGRPGINAALLRVTTTAGIRPSDLDPANADRRLLGCWIETR